MSLNKDLEKLKDQAAEIIAAIAKKENIAAAELETAEKAVCMLNSINKIKAAEMMEDAGTIGGYSGMMYDPALHGDNGYSTYRGRSPITGRFVSRDAGTMDTHNRSYDDGYSPRRHYDGGYSGHNNMIDSLEEMYAKARNDHERSYIKGWLDIARSQFNN